MSLMISVAFAITRPRLHVAVGWTKAIRAAITASGTTINATGTVRGRGTSFVCAALTRRQRWTSRFTHVASTTAPAARLPFATANKAAPSDKRRNDQRRLRWGVTTRKGQPHDSDRDQEHSSEAHNGG